jgi:TubC N-terminal docking domain
VSLTRAILDEMAQRGVTARVDGETLRLKPRKALDDDLLTRIKEHKPEIIRALAAIPQMPVGVRLVKWNPKDPPVAIETCTIVVDPVLFARSTLEQVRVALANPKRWVGWTIPQLIDRLAQVGVTVALEANKTSDAH